MVFQIKLLDNIFKVQEPYEYKIFHNNNNYYYYYA